MKKNDHVAWKWGNGLAEGKIKSIHFESVSIKSRGKIITRHGSESNPAVVIEHKSGHEVLKLASEIQVTNKK